MKSIRLQRCLVGGVCALLLLGSTSLLAATPTPTDRAVLRDEVASRRATPLLFALPAATPGGATVELRVVQGSQTLVRETVALPPTIFAGAAIDVLATHAQVLQRLRAMRPQAALRLVASIGDTTIADESFDSIDQRGRRISPSLAIGEPREIDVNLDRKRLTVSPLTKDPACEDDCYQQYLACYERCDERGDSCAICSQQWSSCVYYCPEQCTEPKSVSYYNVYYPLYGDHYNQYTCASYSYPWVTTGDLWERVYAHYTVYVYQRTEHCDGTHTDTLDHTYPSNFWCSYETSQSCSSPTTTPPTDICP